MPSKPMQRSLKHLKDNGWTVAIVEKWIPPRGTMKFGIRVDLWGFADILACRPLRPLSHYAGNPLTIALVQTTSQSNFAKHRAKILGIPEFYKWKEAGGVVLLHGWAKRGPRGKRKTWQLKEEDL